MRTGKLRHRIDIQRYTVIENELGDQLEYWDTIAYAWAAIEPISGQEFWEAARIAAEVTHKVTMRLPGVTIKQVSPADRIAFGSRILEIESILDIEERGRELVLLCKENLADVWEEPE